MRRTQAAKLIDELRVLVAERKAAGVAVLPVERLERLLEEYRLPPLEPCGGEAHSNAYIDNCSRCAPRWGFVGRFEVVS